jgi:hypothetical protein
MCDITSGAQPDLFEMWSRSEICPENWHSMVLAQKQLIHHQPSGIVNVREMVLPIDDQTETNMKRYSPKDTPNPHDCKGKRMACKSRDFKRIPA